MTELSRPKVFSAKSNDVPAVGYHKALKAVPPQRQKKTSANQLVILTKNKMEIKDTISSPEQTEYEPLDLSSSSCTSSNKSRNDGDSQQLSTPSQTNRKSEGSVSPRCLSRYSGDTVEGSEISIGDDQKEAKAVGVVKKTKGEEEEQPEMCPNAQKATQTFIAELMTFLSERSNEDWQKIYLASFLSGFVFSYLIGFS